MQLINSKALVDYCHGLLGREQISSTQPPPLPSPSSYKQI